MRISTTTLEAYRLWRDPEQDWMSEDDLIATIRGEFRPTREVALGLAFGKILERPDRYRVAGGYGVPDRTFGDLRFEDDVLAPALERIDRPHTVFEAKAVGWYVGQEVVAKADQLVGGTLVETKTCWSGFTWEKYADSCQWRFLADLFQVPRVDYLVFELRESSTGVVSLADVHELPVYAYPALRADCEALVREFVGYLDLKDRAGLGLRAVLEARETALAGGVL